MFPFPCDTLAKYDPVLWNLLETDDRIFIRFNIRAVRGLLSENDGVIGFVSAGKETTTL